MKITSVGNDEIGTLYTADGNIKWCRPMENNMVTPQKIKHSINI